MSLAALAAFGVNASAAVLGGAVLAGISYMATASGVAALTGSSSGLGGADGTGAARGRWTLAKVSLRYALLALLAYVMIARLRLHPIGVLAGASSVVAAAFIEATRLMSKR